ncbi:hypothetical protein C1Y63_06220 [Corynebacterium sp. 13CS0277]|uniref:hypothetical protein n=1 Tax=Corynebacterium sp. 13CS0277 TaxID=2071994 RepID=UPI000D029A96|nr:hypothetical protein [Corynebacterium sp. 13CS0277]PRQ11442.1 hypothetical protein C1Y63_06220 [Corynebacterium sp. 13CS0277]
MSEIETAAVDNASRKNLLLVVAAIVLALVLVIGVGIKLFGGHSEDVAQESAQSAPSAAVTTSYVKPEGDKVLRELKIDYPEGFDPHQRYFDRQFFDDSKYQIGKYGMDLLGDPIYMPVGENGEPFGEFVPTDTLVCETPDTVTIQQQYVHGRSLAVSNQGPTNFEGLIPTGYAKTATAAAIAASNIVTMAMSYRDPIAVEYVTRFSDSVSTKRLVDLGAVYPIPHGGVYPAMDGFKVENCGGDIVVVITASRVPDIESGGFIYELTRLPMRYEDGMWVLVESKQDAKQADQGVAEDLRGFTLVKKA